ncbi:hypothetical protein D3C81_1889260 [compost metagenome]
MRLTLEVFNTLNITEQRVDLRDQLVCALSQRDFTNVKEVVQSARDIYQLGSGSGDSQDSGLAVSLANNVLQRLRKFRRFPQHVGRFADHLRIADGHFPHSTESCLAEVFNPGVGFTFYLRQTAAGGQLILGSVSQVAQFR